MDGGEAEGSSPGADSAALTFESAEETVELAIDGLLDLHGVQPREVAALLEEYLAACVVKGIGNVRVVHGKGIGALRRTVHATLKRSPLVHHFALADESGGGWGATLVVLRLPGA